MIIKCEFCNKNVLKKIGLIIEAGTIDIEFGGAMQTNGSVYPKEIKGDGIFCSLKCLKEWLNKQNKLTIPAENNYWKKTIL